MIASSRVVGLLSAGALFLGVFLPGQASAAEGSAAEGKLLVPASGKVLAGQYIVKLKDGTSPSLLNEIAGRHGVPIKHRYTSAIVGFSTNMSQAQAKRLAADPAVSFVDADKVVHLADVQTNPPNWGLDRIDTDQQVYDQRYHAPNDAAGVRAYVLDTGIRATHVQFGGRVSFGTDVVGDGQNGNDCHGHGTRVASILGGATLGVAKKVSLVNVRVMQCSGQSTIAIVVAGIDWVAANAIRPAVVNMSIGVQADAAVDAAVQKVINKGITVVAAAGNESDIACNYSPGRVTAAITVGNVESDDNRHIDPVDGSNFGSCVDLWAPGTDIEVAGNSNDTITSQRTGTSYAAPHVAGVAAMYLALHWGAPNNEVRDMLVAFAARDKIPFPGPGSPNLLLSTSAVRSPSTLARFYLGTTPYVLLYKPSTGAVAIDRINVGGLGTTNTFSANWTTGWTSIVPFVQEGQQRVFLYKAATGQISIEAINANGAGTTVLWGGTWVKGWTSIGHFVHEGQNRLMFYRAGDGLAAFYKLNAGAQSFAHLWSGTWAKGWTTIAPFSHEGLAKLFFYRISDGKVFVDRVNAGALGTTAMWTVNWTTGWTSLIPYIHEGQQRLMCYKLSIGKFDIEKINTGAGQTTAVFSGSQTIGSTALVPFAQENVVRVLIYKNGGGSVRIDKMNAGSLGTTNLWSSIWTAGWN